MSKLITISAILICMIISVNAQIIHVPGDYSTIQAAINAAYGGDTVLVEEGSYLENINFTGKAITLASWFILDGDTAHISKTIIDGSQSNHPDTASVVSMVSGEDTTSVLSGFTIRGGEGTYTIFKEIPYLTGGGVNILHSGGKIVQNIIEDNNMREPEVDMWVMGFGINAYVTNNHTVIIRKNTIRNNTYSGNTGSSGAGIFTGGGKIIIEDNAISSNISNVISNSSQFFAMGSGIGFVQFVFEGVIPEVIIRNNIITGNEVSGGHWSNQAQGAGIALKGGVFLPLDIKVYNNLIYNNHAIDGWGGGIAVWNIEEADIINNTIVNNNAGLGKQLYMHNNDSVILLNSILWSDTDDGISEIFIDTNYTEHNNVLIARYNNILGDWEGEGNIDEDPHFVEGSFELDMGSPCIGKGIDAIEVNGNTYFAPESDLYGNPRPHSGCPYVDMGAIESSFIAGLEDAKGIKYPVTVYPNPISHILTIEIKQPGLHSIEIISLRGQLIYSTVMDGSNKQIDMTHFRNGVYFITIRSKSFVTNEKIIKL